MNPYNLGCSRNCSEVFWSTIPGSKNDFRAKAEVDSPIDFSSPTFSSREMKSHMPTKSFDLEMVKRKCVDADDFEDIRNHAGSFGKLERCSTEPRRISNEPSWEQKSKWGVTPENI